MDEAIVAMSASGRLQEITILFGIIVTRVGVYGHKHKTMVSFTRISVGESWWRKDEDRLAGKMYFAFELAFKQRSYPFKGRENHVDVECKFHHCCFLEILY